MSILAASERSSIRVAAQALAAGRLVAFPTETVYGLGGLAKHDRAIGSIYAIKRRPSTNPLIAHVADQSSAAIFADMDERAARLATKLWPGPLTLVLPLKVPSAISRLMTVGLSTVAVRVPAHPVARALLEAVELPVAAPSANRSGSVSPTRAEHVVDELGSSVDIVLDGGPCTIGVESTVVDLSRADRASLLRAGGIERERIESLIGPLDAFRPGDTLRAPGLHLRHYSPRTPLRLEATEVHSDEALLAFGGCTPDGAALTLNLSAKGDLGEAAANLYDMMRRLDKAGARRIAAMPVPDVGLGEAINDRLRRAAAPMETASAA